MMQENVTIFDTFSRRFEDQIQPLQDGILCWGNDTANTSEQSYG